MGPLQGLSSGSRERFAKVLAIVHTAVPCKEELVGSKAWPVVLTIIRVQDTGYSVAPFTMGKPGQAAPKPKDGERALPLYEMDTSTSPASLKVWSYVGKGMNRGIRKGGDKHGDETADPPMYNIGTGMSFVMFVNALMFQGSGATKVLPIDCDWIPAMSLVELTIAPRHEESCLEKQRGINVKSMRMCDTEIDAVFQAGIDMVGMPYSAAEAMKNASDRREKYPAIMNDIELEKVSFLVKGESLRKAYMGELPVKAVEATGDGASLSNGAPMGAGMDSQMITTAMAGANSSPAASPEFVKMFVGSGCAAFPSCDYVDIPTDVLMKQTNTTNEEHACALLDVALSFGAVHMLIICDDRWRSRGSQSCYRGVPIVDTNIMFAAMKRLRSVDTDNDMVTVSLHNKDGTTLLDKDGMEITEQIEMLSQLADFSGGMSIKLDTGVDFDDGRIDLVVSITEEDLSKTRPLSITPPPNKALALCGPGIFTSKGYAFSFNVRCAANPSNDVPRIFHGYINRSSAGGGGGGSGKKRKAITME